MPEQPSRASQVQMQPTGSSRLRAIQLAMMSAGGTRAPIRPGSFPPVSIPMMGIRQGRGAMPDTRLPLRRANNILGRIRQGPIGPVSIRRPGIQLVSSILLGSIPVASILGARILQVPINRDRAIPASTRLASTHRVGTRAIDTQQDSIQAISILAGGIRHRLLCLGPTRACPRAGIQGLCPPAGVPIRYHPLRTASWRQACSASFWAASA